MQIRCPFTGRVCEGRECMFYDKDYVIEEYRNHCRFVRLVDMFLKKRR